MKSLLVILFAFSATAFCNSLPAPPPPGTYVGRLAVTKVLPAEGLSSRYSLRAQAKVLAQGTNVQTTVSADGRTTVRTEEPITILTTAPESPVAAADVETTVTRVKRVVTVTQPPPMVHGTIVQVFYYVDGKPAEVFGGGSLLRITYRNPPLAVPADPTAPQPNYTAFEFLLRKLPDVNSTPSQRPQHP